MNYDPEPIHDHLQRAGEEGCDDYERHPDRLINRTLGPDVSRECKRCRWSETCATGGAMDPTFDGSDDEHEDPDDEADRRRRGIYPMGTY